jgi:hypothetical protein
MSHRRHRKLRDTAIGALGGGLVRVLASPQLVAAAIVAMLLVTVPFALVVGSELQGALSNQQPISRDAGEIDPEWWFEFLEHAGGLAATFTPSIIGFAAPLANLSALLDGSEDPPLVMLLPFLLAIVVWSFLWGAALERFAHGPVRFGFLTAGARTFKRFFVISIVAAVILALLYLLLHPLLFGVLAPKLSSRRTERTAFMFMGAISPSTGADEPHRRLRASRSWSRRARRSRRPRSARFVQHFGSTVALYVLTGMLFVALLAVYGYVDVYGGSRVTGWRGIAIAQAYIFARLVIRLTFGASEVRLYRALTDPSTR